MKRFEMKFDEKFFENLKIEAQKNNISVAELIREKIRIADQNIANIDKRIEQKFDTVEKNLEEKIANILAAAKQINKEEINQIIKIIKKDLNIIFKRIPILELYIKITAFYSIYTSIFTTQKWYQNSNFTQKDIDDLEKMKTKYLEQANEITKKIFSQDIVKILKKHLNNELFPDNKN